MSAYIVFTRTKTLDQKELETYWAGIKATMKGHPIEVLVAYGKYEVLEVVIVQHVRGFRPNEMEISHGRVLWQTR
jgi:hypothetical protein